MTTRILLIEPAGGPGAELAAVLGAHGVLVDVVRRAQEALPQVERGAPDALVLDIDGLPEDPLEVLRGLRARSAAPIIVIGSAGDEVEQIVALELGADDYVAKPLTGRLLLARLRSRLRRAGGPPPGSAATPRLRIDPVEREASFDGRPLCLPPSEFDLLRQIAARPGCVVERRQLARLSDGDGEAGLRNIDSRVCRLRKRLAAQGVEALSIRAVSGVGYRLLIVDAAPPPPRWSLAAPRGAVAA